MALWPNKGDEDPRPPQQGGEYVELAPVPPRRPAVPEDAFGALRLPLLPVPKVPAARGDAAEQGGTERERT